MPIGSRPACARIYGNASRTCTRPSSTAVQFYQNKQLEAYASKAATRLSLRQLVFFGRSMNEERLIKSANYVRTELPIRIAHRLRDMQSLPYVVVTQEDMSKVYDLYWTAFEKFRRFPPICTMDDNLMFCDLSKGLLKEHTAVIPSLALGMSISSPHLAPDYLDSFMTRMLVSRISRRVLVEHHIALTDGLYRSHWPSDPKKRGVGIISTDLDARATLERCVELLRSQPQRIRAGIQNTAPSDIPQFIVDGHKSVRFAYIQEHLEYILFELLKNAIKAAVLKHRADHKDGEPPPIRATFVASSDEINIRLSDQGGGIVMPNVHTTADLVSFSHARNPSRLQGDRLVALRVARSRHTGLSATVKEQLDFDLKQEAEIEAAHPQLGIGLPMSNIYANYFGGSLDIVSLDGWGTDVYLRLPKLGTNLEGIEL